MELREKAFSLLQQYTQSESLVKHGLAVEAAMQWYAEHHYKLPKEVVEEWAVCGLLHDFDYERFPDPEPPNGHPYKGSEILNELGYSEEIRTAIMGHADYTGVARTSEMAKTLFAVDELSGLITACVLVRPDRSIHTLTVKSVKKKLKDKAFAKGCNRDDIRVGAEELGLPLEEHIQNVITALSEVSTDLGLQGSESA